MMSTRYVVLGLFLFLGFAAKVHAIKVAIVGGGIASASAAFHLRELLSSTDHLLEIDVFEASDHVGGRTSSITLEGDHTIEMGASIIHAENEVALKLAKLSNLTLSPPQGSEGGLLALFDGTSLVFRQSPWTIITVIKILWRYGLDPLWYRNAAIHFLQDFKRIYALQSNGTSFTHPKDLLHTINCFSLTQMSFVQFIHDTFHGYGMFAAEVVAAASRVNYNQENVELNALAGLVSLLPVVDSRVFTIREGNQRLAERVLLDASGASVHLNSPVAAITGVHPALSRTPGGGGGGRDALMMSSDDDDEDDTVKKYKITLLSRTESSQQEGEAQNRRSTLLTGGVVENSQNEIGDEEEEEEVLYDVVIVAAPLTGSGIVFNGVELPTLPKTRGQETVVTIVKGVLRPTFFGLPPGRLFPFDSILVTEAGGASVPFNSISRVATLRGFKGLYKLFSKAPVPHAWMSMLFDNGYEIVANHTWAAAYPAFDPPENFPPFQLSEGLYYSSAWENGASAIEVAAIGGRNVALLAAEHITHSLQQGFTRSVGDEGRRRSGEGAGLNLSTLSDGTIAAAAA